MNNVKTIIVFIITAVIFSNLACIILGVRIKMLNDKKEHTECESRKFDTEYIRRNVRKRLK